MRNKFDKDAKITLEKYPGLAYDLTIVFNSIKEKKLGNRFRKQNAQIGNIINPMLENELTQQTYEIEEKLLELRKLSKTTICLTYLLGDKIKKCKELYDSNKSQNEKIHIKVEELNSQIYRVSPELIV